MRYVGDMSDIYLKHLYIMAVYVCIHGLDFSESDYCCGVASEAINLWLAEAGYRLQLVPDKCLKYV